MRIHTWNSKSAYRRGLVLGFVVGVVVGAVIGAFSVAIYLGY